MFSCGYFVIGALRSPSGHMIGKIMNAAASLHICGSTVYYIYSKLKAE
jgi:hypothetical protein